MLKKLQYLILIDETLPEEQIIKQLKFRTHALLLFSLVLSFLLIYLLPKDIMNYNWAQNFVNIMSYIVPSIADIEYIREYGPSDETTRGQALKERLAFEGRIALPHISFYYATMWLYAFVAVALRLYYDRKHFKYTTDFGWMINYKRISLTPKEELPPVPSLGKYIFALSFFLILWIMLYIDAGMVNKESMLIGRYYYHFFAATLGFFFTIVVNFTIFLIIQQSLRHRKQRSKS